MATFDDTQPIHFGPPQPSTAAAHLADPDGTLCFCEGIPARTVIAAIRRTGSNRVSEIARRTCAGTNCMSCRTDIADLIRELTGQEPDEHI